MSASGCDPVIPGSEGGRAPRRKGGSALIVPAKPLYEGRDLLHGREGIDLTGDDGLLGGFDEVADVLGHGALGGFVICELQDVGVARAELDVFLLRGGEHS